MTDTGDRGTVHHLLDDACQEAAGWLLQAGALLQAAALIAGLTATLDLLGVLPQGYDTDHQIDILLLVATPELFMWGRRWARRALAKADQLTADDGA